MVRTSPEEVKYFGGNTLGPRARFHRHGPEVYFFRPALFRGTLAPAFRASLRPMAIACLRLVTFLPDRPDLSVPFFRSCIARLTLLCAFFPYFAMTNVLRSRRRCKREAHQLMVSEAAGSSSIIMMTPCTWVLPIS